MTERQDEYKVIGYLARGGTTVTPQPLVTVAKHNFEMFGIYPNGDCVRLHKDGAPLTETQLAERPNFISEADGKSHESPKNLTSFAFGPRLTFVGSMAEIADHLEQSLFGMVKEDGPPYHPSWQPVTEYIQNVRALQAGQIVPSMLPEPE